MHKSDLDIDHLARLANLTLLEKEKRKFPRQLRETVQYIKVLQEKNTKNTEPCRQVTGIINRFRTDTKKEGLTSKDALTNSKKRIGNFFATAKIRWE